MSRYFKAKIADNLSLNSKNILLTFEPLEPAPEPRPGQFYMIEAGDSYDPLLKRPFSYMRRTPETLQFLCTVRGRGTSLMKEFRRGKTVNMMGPLGTYAAAYRGRNRCGIHFLAGGRIRAEIICNVWRQVPG